MKTINVVSRHPNPWLRQFPGSQPFWGDWQFIFNEKNLPYDFLVVFDNAPEPIKIKCPSENTLHISTEPPSFFKYSIDYLNQFRWIITQDKTIKNREGVIYHHGGLTWFLGWDPQKPNDSKCMNFYELQALANKPKSKLCSIITSNKQYTPGHIKRIDFAKKLKNHYGESLDLFGRGFRTMADKIESLENYRFQIVIENAEFDHYFTEKLSDCFINGTYPIYYGCPNLDSYFPANSFQPININNIQESILLIDRAIKENYDLRFKEQLQHAKESVMHEHNLFPMLVRVINKIEAIMRLDNKEKLKMIHHKEIFPF